MTKEAVDKLKHEAWGELRIIRACSTCRHREFRGGYGDIAMCGATGTTCSSERSGWGPCGAAGSLWEPRPPASPRAPGFWKRLGNAILARIESGKEKS